MSSKKAAECQKGSEGIFPSSLTTRIPPTTEQFAIVSTIAAEGETVILQYHTKQNKSDGKSQEPYDFTHISSQGQRVSHTPSHKTTVTENEEMVVMTCYSNARSTNWLFNATSLWLRERMKLSQDRRTLTRNPVRREDAGNYQCKASNIISSFESAPVELDVKY
ncbi:hypothetical protein QTO34_010317 [Cnephaeus nilssonii]|uniref:Ig-like domain-containing protein n=1 Tax=Cnephaeus nilssonii TaxID=3371016 RepID=A0AA40HF88_CNENI|nr:hypothetical protein QTO34_010317 [Eptesicus nilssonii]